MMWWNHNGWGLGDWLTMSAMMVLVWGLLVALAVWLVRASRKEHTAPEPQRAPANRSADLMLAERFARGEIDEDEFAHRRAVLHSADGSSTSGGG
jgi:putative membrane protein